MYLNILLPAVLSQHLVSADENLTVFVGENVLIECPFSEYENIKLKLGLDGKRVAEYNEFRRIHGGQLRESRNWYQINNVTTDTSGDYYCVAGNNVVITRLTVVEKNLHFLINGVSVMDFQEVEIDKATKLTLTCSLDSEVSPQAQIFIIMDGRKVKEDISLKNQSERLSVSLSLPVRPYLNDLAVSCGLLPLSDQIGCTKHAPGHQANHIHARLRIKVPDSARRFLKLLDQEVTFENYQRAATFFYVMVVAIFIYLVLAFTCIFLVISARVALAEI